MLDGRRVSGLLLMGGVGRRFGSEVPKQFHRLSGKPVYLVTLEAFLDAGIFDEIVLSCHSDWIEAVKAEVSHLPTVRVVEGGTSRKESSWKGLMGFTQKPDVVLIHDAVRPFVSKEVLLENARLAIKHGAVDTCIASADTLVHSLDGTQISSIPQREEYLRGQTPQSFSYDLIVEAHKQWKGGEASDDCRLVLALGAPIWVAKGDEHNLKITSELDLFIAEQLFRLRVNKPKVTHASLNNKKIAVVGGSGGIGSEICLEIETCGGVAISLSSQEIDLKDPHSIEKMFTKLGPIDGLINCAGLLYVRPLQQLSLTEVTSLLDVNLKGLILSCKAAQINVGGHVINIASSSFSRGRKETTVYSCAKAAVVNFTQGFAEERPELRIHAVIPQRTRTPMRLENFPTEDPSQLLDPAKVAKTVVKLLMDNTSTGMLVEVKQS